MVAERPMIWTFFSSRFRMVMRISSVGPLPGSLRRWISSMMTVETPAIHGAWWRRRESSFSEVVMMMSYSAR